MKNSYDSRIHYCPKTNYKALFEQQSYCDALEYFQNTLTNPELPVWDYVILTASNEAQAKAYEIQIAHRLKNAQLPGGTYYAVISDLNGQRVGSGGATLSCVKYVYEKEQEKSKIEGAMLVILMTELLPRILSRIKTILRARKFWSFIQAETVNEFLSIRHVGSCSRRFPVFFPAAGGARFLTSL